jgi:hypothetical protein
VHLCRLLIGALAIGAAFTLGACGGQPTASRQSLVKSHPTIGLRARLTPWRLPFPVAGEVALAQRGRLLVIGGLDSSGASSESILALDPRTGDVRDRGALVQPTHDAAGAVLGGNAFVFGGETASGQSTDVIQEVVPRAGRTRIVASLPTATDHAAAVAFGDRIYVLGGDVAGIASRQIVLFDPLANRVRRISQLPLAVADAAVVRSGAGAYLLGGLGTGQTPSSRVIRLTPGG